VKCPPAPSSYWEGRDQGGALEVPQLYLPQKLEDPEKKKVGVLLTFRKKTEEEGGESLQTRI